FSSPYGEIKFSRLWTRLYISSDLYTELDHILSRCQRRPPILHTYWIIVPSILLGLVGILLGLLPDKGSSLSLLGLSAPSWTAALQLFLTPWFLWVVFLQVRRHSVIHLVRRSAARPFLERNRDQLWMMVISAVVGGLLYLHRHKDHGDMVFEAN